MRGKFDGASDGGHRIMPKGLGFVLDVKKPKKYLKSHRCSVGDHTNCSGRRVEVHFGFMTCECPCHSMELDPNL